MIDLVPFTPHVPQIGKRTIWSHLGYVPSREAQVFHDSRAHIRVIYGGWRAGKSTASVMDIVGLPLVPMPRERADGLTGLIWVIGPDFNQAHAEFLFLLQAWKKLGIAKLETLSMPKDGRWSVQTSTGWQLETQSSRYMETLGSVTVDAIIVAEAGQHEEEIIAWVLGRTAETFGPIILSGTLEAAKAWYGELATTYPEYPNEADIEWFSLPTWSNPIYHRNPDLSKCGEQDPRLQQIKVIVGARTWRMRFGGQPEPPKEMVFWDFCPAPRVVISDQNDELSIGPICHVTQKASWDPEGRVLLAVDPGEVYTVLACQWKKAEQTRRDTDETIVVPVLSVFDEISIPHGFFHEVREQVLAWQTKGYKLDSSYHDRATAQHHNQRSQQELWQDYREHGGIGLSVSYSPEPLGIADGVELFHRWLIFPLTGKPLIAINPQCKELITQLRHERYHRARANSSSTDIPIDRDNHGRKALCYLLYYIHGHRLPMEDEALRAAFGPIKGWSSWRRKKHHEPGIGSSAYHRS